MAALRPMKWFRHATPDTYLLDIKACRDTNSLFAVSASDNAVSVYATETQQLVGSISIDNKSGSNISDFVFDEANTLFIASKDVPGGVVRKDLRMEGFASVFKIAHSALSLSVNADASLLAVGTSHQQDESSIMFWDLASTAPIAQFTESHSDDVTRVTFHPSQPRLMMTGSTDGLVNLFNLTSTLDEEDSLHQVIKSDSVSKLNFFGPSSEFLSCCTHMETYTLHSFEDASLIKNYGDVRSELKDISPIDYLIDSHYDANTGQLKLYTGTQDGQIAVWNAGDTLSLECVLNGHCDIVRGIQSLASASIFLTCGEDGIVCIYKQ